MPTRQYQSDVIEREELREPPLYRVLLLNDDYTPMDFVVFVLMGVFGKTEAEASAIMLNVHHQGSGVCGVYAFEEAETKVDVVEGLAAKHGHPLKCAMEEE